MGLSFALLPLRQRVWVNAELQRRFFLRQPQYRVLPTEPLSPSVRRDSGLYAHTTLSPPARMIWRWSLLSNLTS